MPLQQPWASSDALIPIEQLGVLGRVTGWDVCLGGAGLL